MPNRLLLLTASALIAGACGASSTSQSALSPPNNPEAVAEAWSRAIDGGDWQTVVALTHADYADCDPGAYTEMPGRHPDDAGAIYQLDDLSSESDDEGDFLIARFTLVTETDERSRSVAVERVQGVWMVLEDSCLSLLDWSILDAGIPLLRETLELQGADLTPPAIPYQVTNDLDQSKPLVVFRDTTDTGTLLATRTILDRWLCIAINPAGDYRYHSSIDHSAVDTHQRCWASGSDDSQVGWFEPARNS